jgi:hypothetical protein
MKRLTTLWNLWYPVIGAAATVWVSWRLGADARVFRAADPGAAGIVFSGMLTFSALLASVLLALLAIIASLDSRPIVQEIRKASLYPELVNSAFQPLVSFILLAGTSLLALFLTAKDSNLLRRVVVTFALAATAFGILSTARFARLLVRVMIDPKGSKPWNPKDTPAGARERGATDPNVRSEKHVS